MKRTNKKSRPRRGRRPDTVEEIRAKIARVDEELVDQLREIPFNFSADEFLIAMAEHREITDREIVDIINAFLNRPAVARRLRLFKKRARLQHRLEMRARSAA